jgi:hypothetical protein
MKSEDERPELSNRCDEKHFIGCYLPFAAMERPASQTVPSLFPGYIVVHLPDAERYEGTESSQGAPAGMEDMLFPET